ncbi:MAG TPA: hypothetical protein VFQ59_01730 [Candidatus Paceibacterota bacterium]|nr:hypothetical protein [Candidatus Paceibacterota bacterium]
MVALFVNTLNRMLSVMTVSVTKVANGIILRYGAEIGMLGDLTVSGVFKNLDMPIIIPVTGYKAQSSSGFVEIVRRDSRLSTHVLGSLSMPFFGQKKCLTVLPIPVEVLILDIGTHVKLLETHGNSNSGSAFAAEKGIRLKSQIKSESVFILEGQSDYVCGWELYQNREIERILPNFPEEHRSEMFSGKNLAYAFTRRMSKQRFFSIALGKIAEEVRDHQGLFGKIEKKIQSLTSIPTHYWKIFTASAVNAYESMSKSKEFSARVIGDKAGMCSIEVTGPEGREEISFELKDTEWYSIEDKLIDLSSNTDEEKEKIRHDRRVELLKKTFDRWVEDEKSKMAFEQAENFSIGYLMEIQDGDKEIRLMSDIYSGSLNKVMSQVDHYADREEMIGLISHDKDGNSDSIVVQRNWDNNKNAHVGIGYSVLLSVVPWMKEEYRTKPQRVKEILSLLESFGTLSVSRFGNTRRDHHATYVADETGKVICGIFANGSDYRTPSLQEVAETKELNDWVLAEPFNLKIAYNSRTDIVDALIKKGKELNIKVSTSGGFSI